MVHRPENLQVEVVSEVPFGQRLWSATSFQILSRPHPHEESEEELRPVLADVADTFGQLNVSVADFQKPKD